MEVCESEEVFPADQNSGRVSRQLLPLTLREVKSSGL